MTTPSYYYPHLPPVPLASPQQEPLNAALLAICSIMKSYSSSESTFSSSAKVKRCYCYPNRLPIQHIHHHYYGKVAEKEERDNRIYSVAVVIFSAVGLVSSYLIGKELGVRRELIDARNLVCEHSIKTLHYQLSGYDELLKDTDRFFRNRQSEVAYLLAAKVALLVGALVALTGCLNSSPVALGIGAVIACTATCGMLVERGFQETSRCKEREAKRILRAAEDLLTKVSVAAFEIT